jgi:hypothetical protein
MFAFAAPIWNSSTGVSFRRLITPLRSALEICRLPTTSASLITGVSTRS